MAEKCVMCKGVGWFMTTGGPYARRALCACGRFKSSTEMQNHINHILFGHDDLLAAACKGADTIGDLIGRGIIAHHAALKGRVNDVWNELKREIQKAQGL